MVMRTPLSFKAGRIVLLGNTTYQPGTTVPNAVVKGLHNLNALIARQILIVDAPVRVGTNRGKSPTPTYLSASMRKNL